VAHGADVFAGTDIAGVFRLSDGASAWVPFAGTLPDGAQVFDLAVQGETVYAALYSKGLYRASLSGGGWRRVSDVEPLRVYVSGASLLVGHNPGGVRWSSDEGVTWQLARGLPQGAPIWTLGAAGASLLAGTSPGTLLQSRDHGVTWGSVTGLPVGGVSALSGPGAVSLAVVVTDLAGPTP
jgi:hypothetical protein